MWVHQFYYEGDAYKLRPVSELPPASISCSSPYDPEAHAGNKGATQWTGYKVHLTETCDDERPHLITHVETTIASLTDANMIAPIHQALAEKDLLPETHLVDTGYVDAEQIIKSQTEHDLYLLGPVRHSTSWQAKEESAYTLSDFKINWEAAKVICPNGASSSSWATSKDPRGNEVIRVAFSNKDCRSCSLRALCTRRKIQTPRTLTLRPRAQHECLQNLRQLQKTDEWRTQYAKRAGIEGTISQAVRGFGMRTSRYIGLAKTHLQHVLTAAAINLARLDAWFTDNKPAQTRVSRFAALRPTTA